MQNEPVATTERHHIFYADYNIMYSKTRYALLVGDVLWLGWESVSKQREIERERGREGKELKYNDKIIKLCTI